jgi:hypothetical protein
LALFLLLTLFSFSARRGFERPDAPNRKKASMAFDADPLWWPPAARLHATLASSAAAAAVAAKNGNVEGDDDASFSPSSSSAAAAQRLSSTLKEYERWLIAGLHTFKRRGGGAAVGGSSGESPSSSREALLAGAPLSLSNGAKKIAVDGRLVQAALELAIVAVSSSMVSCC